ncbi:MAG: RidA family protein [Pseudomonadota bacterium]|nr:RidA family protein [Pseudomonadota bacterium]
MAKTIEARLKELGIELPEAVAPVANYVPYVITGNLVIVSGQIPFVDGAVQSLGRVGQDLSVENGQSAARLCALNLLAQVNAAADGDLDLVTRVVRLGGFVNSAPDFTGQHLVINAASELMVDVFGDKGQHARAAVGCPSLPLGAAVEVDGIFELKA